jgi:Tfp pilus assembly protein PilV
MASKPLSLNRSRSAFTLVEALVAVTVTLIMMLALSKGFVMMSQSISDGRSKLTLSDQLRGISSKLREDLIGMTAGGDPNLESNRSGYFEYYEGPISDYLPALVNFDQRMTNLEEKNPASRYGDFDDILAFTSKAKKGQWFYGEVPYPLVMGPAQMARVAAGLAATDNYPDYDAEDWARMVTVASDTAEIVYFMMPYGADPYQFLTATTPPLVDFSNSVRADLVPITTSSPTAVGVPARMVLCRRVLLVLPELNVQAGVQMPGMASGVVTPEPMLFHYLASSLNPQTQLHVDALGDPGSPIVNNYRVGMQVPYQRCDLSVRRVSDGNQGTPDPIAANTLADLQDPKNRFAHTVLPALTGSSTADTTMPIWSLTGPIPLQVSALTGLALEAVMNGTVTLQDGNFGTSIALTTQQPEVGFIYPQFLRQRRTDAASTTRQNEAGITYEVAFSEVLANNCISFDVKGYDPQLTQWYHPGIDGVQQYGMSGSDDVIVSPSDPGYANVMARLYSSWNNGAPPTWIASPDQYIARTGGFADLGWALSLRSAAAVENGKMTAGAMNASNPNTWVTDATNTYIPQLSSALSMTYPGPVFGGLAPFTQPALKSGRVVTDNPSGLVRVYQPTFDTFTGRYEVDGYMQSSTSTENGGYNGTIWINGQHQYKFPSDQIPYDSSYGLPASSADRGANGIDDNGFGGIDDVSEKDSTPPISSPLRAVQVTIRVEDKGANVIQQVVVDHELRLEN